MKFRDQIGESLLNLRRRPMRTAFAAGGVAVGALAVALLLSLGAGLHNFVEAQTLAFSDPVELEVSAEKRISVSNVLDYALGQIGTPARPIQEEQAEQRQMMRSFGRERPRFTEDQINKIKAMAAVATVETQQRAWLHSITLEGQTARFRVDLRQTYAGPRIPLVAGRNLDPEAKEAEVIVAWQWIQAFGLTKADELLGKKIGMTVSGSKGRRQEMFLEYSDDPETFKTLTAKVVGITGETIASRAMFVSRKFAKSLSKARSTLKSKGGGGRRGPFGGPPEPPPESKDGKKKKGPHSVIVRARSINEVGTLKEALEKAGHGVISLDDRLGVIGRIFLVIDAVLASVGAVAFLVASLGIANTLIMAVHERTSEIGLWKAMGATDQDIGVMFSLEAAAMGVLGGLMGISGAVCLGLVGEAVAGRLFLQNIVGYQVFVFPWWLVVATVGLSTLVSLLAGIWPARRASRLAPVAALRRDD